MHDVSSACACREPRLRCSALRVDELLTSVFKFLVAAPDALHQSRHQLGRGDRVSSLVYAAFRSKIALDATLSMPCSYKARNVIETHEQKSHFRV
jgi:hypothetical protein